MQTISPGIRTRGRPRAQRARQQVDTALRWRRFSNGLSTASPVVRGFALAAWWSVLLWLAVFAVDNFV